MPFELRVRGGRSLVAGKVVCVAKNYADHVREMAGQLWSASDGDRAPPSDPVFFLKPSTALVHDGGAVRIPAGVGLVHHEVEMVALIGREARRVRREDALDHVAGYGVGIDVTARDLQQAAKKAGLPWAVAKGMDTFAPVSEFVPAGEVPDPHALDLELRVNGEVHQSGDTAHMIHRLPDLIAHASRFMTLEPGDLVMTGTPAGVGPLAPGDVCEARLGDLVTLRVDVESDEA